jgi:cytochrome c553
LEVRHHFVQIYSSVTIYRHLPSPSANPRIGDQSAAYLAATIRQFRSGSHANSPGMSDLVRTLDEGDIDAVAAYLNAAQ